MFFHRLRAILKGEFFLQKPDLQV
ncbi:Molybdenum cofactor biosynthesis protein MoaC [Pseudomonas sp. XWY-1]|nr:Molybdenum cofactor biosynthesis protein MoaC [Pseudomonas sp. XWY-1]